MYKASRRPTRFWHKDFGDLIRIVGFTFTFGFIIQTSGIVSEYKDTALHISAVSSPNTYSF